LLNGHSTSPSRQCTVLGVDHQKAVSAPENIASTVDDICFTERNFLAEDAEIFAPYQPLNGRLYDLGNPFDRTNLALRIRRCIDSRQDYICLIERLYRAKLMPKRDYLGHTAEAAIQLQRHRKALFLLASLGSY
jgi:hypothetical protein